MFVRKNQTRFDNLAEKIISLYSGEMTTGEAVRTLKIFSRWLIQNSTEKRVIKRAARSARNRLFLRPVCD